MCTRGDMDCVGARCPYWMIEGCKAGRGGNND